MRPSARRMGAPTSTNASGSCGASASLRRVDRQRAPVQARRHAVETCERAAGRRQQRARVGVHNQQRQRARQAAGRALQGGRLATAPIEVGRESRGQLRRARRLHPALHVPGSGRTPGGRRSARHATAATAATASAPTARSSLPLQATDHRRSPAGTRAPCTVAMYRGSPSGADLAPQVGDVRVHGAVEAVVVGAERARDQLLAREGAPRMRAQRLEQPELRWRQRHAAAGRPCLAPQRSTSSRRPARRRARRRAVRRPRRRSSAWMRATTSRGLNGLGT